MHRQDRSRTKELVAKFKSNLKPAELLRMLRALRLLSRFNPSFFDIPDLPPRIKAMVGQGVGKLRRFALHSINEEYIAQMAQRRHGECRRCGYCCKMLFECPFLKNLPDGTGRCRIHGRKPDNCTFFPIDERDLRERNLAGAPAPCGYRFQ